MPTALAPAILASCPTSEPTGPLAAATTTVSPGLGLPMSVEPGIGGKARHAEHAQPGRDRRQLAGRAYAGAGALPRRMRAPAGTRQHDIAGARSRDDRRRSPRTRSRQSSLRRRRPAWHRISDRPCGRACRGRATDRAPAAAARRAAAPASALPPAGSSPPSADPRPRRQYDLSDRWFAHVLLPCSMTTHCAT